MPINSRQKGKRGELAWRDILRALGFTARRGQQFNGGGDSPDVVCSELDDIHCEVKFGVTGMDEGTALLDRACEQAERDAKGKPWYVAWKPGRAAWRVTFVAEKPGLRVTVSGEARIKAALLWMSNQGKETRN